MLVEIMDLDCLQMYHKCIQKIEASYIHYRHNRSLFVFCGYLVVDSKIPMEIPLVEF